jgi:hypothetical protein
MAYGMQGRGEDTDPVMGVAAGRGVTIDRHDDFDVVVDVDRQTKLFGSIVLCPMRLKICSRGCRQHWPKRWRCPLYQF